MKNIFVRNIDIFNMILILILKIYIDFNIGIFKMTRRMGLR